MASLTQKLVEMAIAILVVAILLNIAWQIVQPLLPMIVIVTLGVAAIRLISLYRRHW